jgi:hypothetical protein
MHLKNLLRLTSCLGMMSVLSMRAEYMEPQMYEQQQSDAQNVAMCHDTYDENRESSKRDREQQTRADDDPPVQSCIAEAIMQKYCS